jgi:lipase
VHLADRLPGHRILAPDLRGHGASGKEPPWDIGTHIADLLETIEEPIPDWLGFSFGGRIAATIAATYPERVRSLILLDPALHIPPATAHKRAEGALERERYPSFTSAVDGQQDPDNPYESPRAHREEEVRENFTEENGVYTAKWDPAMAVVAFSEMSRPAPSDASVPTLSVLAEGSWIPPIPRGDVVTLRSGHSVLWDAFDQTADAVARHLESRP